MHPTSHRWTGLSGGAWLLAGAQLIGSAQAADEPAAQTVRLGASGKTFADTAAQCAPHPTTGRSAPRVQAGLFNPRRQATGQLWLDGMQVQALDAEAPAGDLWLSSGGHTVVVSVGRHTTDTYRYQIPAGLCGQPPGGGNFFSPDGRLEYAGSGKSYLTVQPGCAWNPARGVAQRFVHLTDNGNFLLNVSVNGVPLTQLSASRPHTVVFLGAGRQLITAANGSLSTDSYVRDGGTGSCTL
jgi:hypothetical protein